MPNETMLVPHNLSACALDFAKQQKLNADATQALVKECDEIMSVVAASQNDVFTRTSTSSNKIAERINKLRRKVPANMITDYVLDLIQHRLSNVIEESAFPSTVDSVVESELFQEHIKPNVKAYRRFAVLLSDFNQHASKHRVNNLLQAEDFASLEELVRYTCGAMVQTKDDLAFKMYFTPDYLERALGGIYQRLQAIQDSASIEQLFDIIKKANRENFSAYNIPNEYTHKDQTNSLVYKRDLLFLMICLTAYDSRLQLEKFRESNLNNEKIRQEQKINKLKIVLGHVSNLPRADDNKLKTEIDAANLKLQSVASNKSLSLFRRFINFFKRRHYQSRINRLQNALEKSLRHQNDIMDLQARIDTLSEQVSDYQPQLELCQYRAKTTTEYRASLVKHLNKLLITHYYHYLKKVVKDNNRHVIDEVIAQGGVLFKTPAGNAYTIKNAIFAYTRHRLNNRRGKKEVTTKELENCLILMKRAIDFNDQTDLGIFKHFILKFLEKLEQRNENILPLNHDFLHELLLTVDNATVYHLLHVPAIRTVVRIHPELLDPREDNLHYVKPNEALENKVLAPLLQARNKPVYDMEIVQRECERFSDLFYQRMLIANGNPANSYPLYADINFLIYVSLFAEPAKLRALEVSLESHFRDHPDHPISAVTKEFYLKVLHFVRKTNELHSLNNTAEIEAFINAAKINQDCLLIVSEAFTEPSNYSHEEGLQSLVDAYATLMQQQTPAIVADLKANTQKLVDHLSLGNFNHLIATHKIMVELSHLEPEFSEVQLQTGALISEAVQRFSNDFRELLRSDFTNTPAKIPSQYFNSTFLSLVLENLNDQNIDDLQTYTETILSVKTAAYPRILLGRISQLLMLHTTDRVVTPEQLSEISDCYEDYCVHIERIDNIVKNQLATNALVSLIKITSEVKSILTAQRFAPDLAVIKQELTDQLLKAFDNLSIEDNQAFLVRFVKLCAYLPGLKNCMLDAVTKKENKIYYLEHANLLRVHGKFRPVFNSAPPRMITEPETSAALKK